jgi:16S rRNA (cytosine967-C5)-methyltransferase
MRFQSYFNTAVLLIRQYDGSTPLLHFLKQYFSQHKKHGAKDRKYISHLCYNYYRLGHALKENSPEERLRVALFFCNDSAGEWQIVFEENWIAHWNTALKSRIDFVAGIFPSFSINDIFPWTDELSEGIEKENFILSHFTQPDLFLRIRPGREKSVLQKLNEHQIAFKQIEPYCLVLPNSSKVDTILEIDKEVVVQDYSSQRISEFFQLQTPNSKLQTQLWDCCAASGGKSLLAFDLLKNIELTVSDVRPVILRNLKERFEKAGIKHYQSFVTDLTDPLFKIHHSKFNTILCDAPCSGSGTWGRMPEQLYFFSKEKINEYASLQKKIVQNVMSKVAEDGYLLYITCSVFKKENEEIVSFIQQQPGFELVKMELLKGYDAKADSMFAALLKKS